MKHEDLLKLLDTCPMSGQGGEYVVENGARRLVSRTDTEVTAPAAPDTAEPPVARARTK